MLKMIFEKMSSNDIIGFISLMTVFFISGTSLFFSAMRNLKESKNKDKILSKFLDKNIDFKEAEFLFNKVDNEYNRNTQQNNKLNLAVENYNVAHVKENIQYNIFRFALISTIVLFIGLILTTKDIFLIKDLNILSIINRMLLVLPFLVLILFFSKEASRHRKSMIINRQKYLDLHILNEYITSLPKDKQVEVKIKLLGHFFNHKEFDYKCEPLISKEFLETLKVLQKTFEFEGKNLDKVKSLKKVIKKD